MSIAVRVDPDDPTPPYEQLRRQIEAVIRSGQLGAGTRLPTVRQLASDLGLAAGTVARTYRELETAGLVATRRAAGTRVADGVARLDDAARSRRLADLAGGLIAEARVLGFDGEQVVDAVRRAVAEAD